MENNKSKLNINQWAEADRPREKMMSKGVDPLSDAELLAILIGSGNTDESAVALMRRVLTACHNDLNELGKWTLRDYAQFKGLGPAKTTSIMAALELGKRRKAQEIKERDSITCSGDIYRLFHPLLCDLPHEEFWILLLNKALKVIIKTRISIGGIDATHVDMREVLRQALIHSAVKIILCHNHPSGNRLPSQSDIQLTNSIKQGARTMNIDVADHVIICDGFYYSFADEGQM